jgi:hypothetical protein
MASDPVELPLQVLGLVAFQVAGAIQLQGISLQGLGEGNEL